MINVFYRIRNTIGQFMVALIFLGTFGFLFTSDEFVSESEASGCCGGGEAVVTTFAVDSSGDFRSDIPMDAEVTDGCCGGEDNTILSSDSSGCNCLGPDGPCSCGSGRACGGSGALACPSSNPNCSVDTGVCANYCKSWCEEGNGSVPCQGSCDK